MTRIGFIGLGTMGKPMAANLARAGFTVTGYSRRAEPIPSLLEAGVSAAQSVADAVGDADVIALMLPDGPDVTQVLAGPDGVFDHAAKGTLIIDFSSISPHTSRSLAEAGEAHGLRMLDAPVSGGESGAIDGTLSIMVGGNPEDTAAAMPVLRAVGRSIERVGAHGSGQLVKAANQLIVAGTIQLVSEALLLLESADIDVDAAINVLAHGLAGNRILDLKTAGMRARSFTPGFRAELHHKDLRNVTAIARDAGVALPVGSVVAQLMAALVARGQGDLDHTALLCLLDDMSRRTGQPARPT